MQHLTTTLVLSTLALWVADPAAPQDSRRNKKKKEDLAEQRAVPKVFKIGLPIDLDITLKDVEGKEHRLGDYEDKVLVIDFWSNRCPWSRKAEEKFLALQTHFAHDDVVLLMIDPNVGDLADGEKDGYLEIREYCKKNKTTYPILLDPGNVVADRFDAQATPHAFVVDRNGILRYSGGIDDDPRQKKTGTEREFWLQDAVRAVLDDEEVDEPKTKPFGCSIKRVKGGEETSG